MKAIVFFTILAFQMVSHYVSQAGIYLVNLNYLYLTFQVARMQVHTIKILMWKKVYTVISSKQDLLPK